MSKLVINKDLNNTYFISESNDERLNIIAQILIDKKLRKYFYKILNDISTVAEHETYHITSVDNNFDYTFHLKGDQFLVINLREINKPEEIKNIEELEKVYQTDIPKDTLIDLIINIEELMDSQKNEIILTASQDNFNIE